MGSLGLGSDALQVLGSVWALHALRLALVVFPGSRTFFFQQCSWQLQPEVCSCAVSAGLTSLTWKKSCLHYTLQVTELTSFQENLMYINLGQRQGTFFVLPSDPWSPVMATFITQTSFPRESILWICSDLNELSTNHQIFHIPYGSSGFPKWHHQLGWLQGS